jgi:flagellar protein FlgJ
MDLAALQSVGHEFEGIFFSMLLKEMRTSLDSSGEGGLFAGEKTDTLGGLFDLYMGQHLASSNSLGISRAILSYLSNQPKSSATQGDSANEE